jgi:Tfp pilus assembly protein PilF
MLHGRAGSSAWASRSRRSPSTTRPERSTSRATFAGPFHPEAASGTHPGICCTLKMQAERGRRGAAPPRMLPRLIRRRFEGGAWLVSLNITVVSREIIYQSGDFRLSDRRGKPLILEAQKQIPITRFGWSAVVAFVGVGSVDNLKVANWLIERIAAIPQSADFDALIAVLLSADEWLKRVELKWRFHTFSVGAFVGHHPLFAMVSNFEAVHTMPSRVVRPRLRATYLRPRRERVLVTGRPATVSRLERQSLVGLLRASETPEAVMNALARVNAAAHTRDRNAISPHCFTSYVRHTGEGGGMIHGLGSGPYMPGFDVPKEMEDVLEALLREQFPQGAQMRSFSSMRAPASEAEHLVQLRAKPNDPNAHNNYGAYLRDVVKDDSRAEQAYLRALELDPNHSNALGNLANLLWDRGELDRAEELYRHALQAGPDNVTQRINFGKFLLSARGDLDAALAVCEQGLPSDNADLLALYCELLVRGGAYARAAEHYASLYKLRPESADVALNYGTVLQVTGTAPATVESLYRQVLTQEPDNGKAMLNLAQIRYRMGAAKEAGTLIRGALRSQLASGEKAEALYCWYAFEQKRESLLQLRALLLAEARSLGWDLNPVAEMSIALGHPAGNFVRVLGEVVVGTKPLEELNRFTEWRNLAK